MRQLDMNLQDNEKKSKKRYYEWKYFPLMKPLSAEKPWFSPMIMCSLGFATDTDIRFGYGAEFMISGAIIMYPHPTLKKVKNHHLDALKKLKNKKWNYFSPIHQYESLKSSPRKFGFLNSEFYVHLRYNIKGFIIFDKDIFGIISFGTFMNKNLSTVFWHSWSNVQLWQRYWNLILLNTVSCTVPNILDLNNA